jgi:hypothetical protein
VTFARMFNLKKNDCGKRFIQYITYVTFFLNPGTAFLFCISV